MAIIKCTNSIFIPPLLSVHMSSFMHLPVLCFSPIFWKIFIYKIIRNGDLKVFDYFFYDLYTFVVPELWDFILWNIVSCMHVRPLTSILPLLILFKLQHIIGNGGKSFGPLCFIWGFGSPCSIWGFGLPCPIWDFELACSIWDFELPCSIWDIELTCSIWGFELPCFICGFELPCSI